MNLVVLPQIEVYPGESGGWRWRKRDGDNAGEPSATFDTRQAAFEDALIEREAEAIVLLRADGSAYGELYHAKVDGGPPQHVDLLAASTRDEALSVDG